MPFKRLLSALCFVPLWVTAPAQALDTDALITVQRQLHALGYEITDDEGRIGADTKQALDLFRDDNDLPKRQWLNDGLVTIVAERYAAMYRRRGEAVPTPAAIPSNKLGKYCVVTSGSLELATDDAKVQRQLGELGYRPGNIVGKSSVATRNAISNFQLENNLPVTGQANALTRQLLLAAVTQLRSNRRRAETLSASR